MFVHLLTTKKKHFNITMKQDRFQNDFMTSAGRLNFQNISNYKIKIYLDLEQNQQKWHSVFQRFRQAKFAYGGSFLNSNQFSLLSQLPQKVKLALKVVKIDSKIIISLLWCKSLKPAVYLDTNIVKSDMETNLSTPKHFFDITKTCESRYKLWSLQK